MLRPKNIGLVNQKRTLRALYAQTQAYPYAATLGATSGISAGSNSQTALTGADGLAGAALIWPGAVMEMVAPVDATVGGEVVRLSDGTLRPFGLCANFVGGNMDELNGRTDVGVWRGRGGVFEVLAPLFSTTITGTDGGLGAQNAGADTDGVLTDVESDDSTAVDLRAARLLNILGANAIIVELTVGG